MKKLLITIGVMVLLFSAAPVFAKGDKAQGPKEKDTCKTIQDGGILDTAGNPIEVGYDQWGYNYQARMFNGYYDNSGRPETPITEGDWLMMKWSDEWLSNKDCNNDKKLDRGYSCDPELANSSGCPGAWLTNHMYGTYESEEYNWDVSGDWVISVNDGKYLHDYTFTMTSLEDGTFTGVGGYPADATDYTYDEIVINGLVDGDNITFTASYYVDGNPTGYSWTAQGTIDNVDGSISGTGNAGVYAWESVEGLATKVYGVCEWDYFVKIVAAPVGAYENDDYWYTESGEELGPVIWGAFAIIQEVENDPCAGYEGIQYLSPAGPGFGKWK